MSLGGINLKPYITYDTEVSKDRVKDIGAVSSNGSILHTSNLSEFSHFIQNTIFLVGHNSIHHDNRFLGQCFKRSHRFIDTLYLSPLMFPKRPYHRLIKDDKLLTDTLNNPVNDSKNASLLFEEELNQFFKLDEPLKAIYYTLLKDTLEFRGFFEYVETSFKGINLEEQIKYYFQGKICESISLKPYIVKHPIALAYVLSMIHAMNDELMPPWVFMNFPIVDEIMHRLRGTVCEKECNYCKTINNPKSALKTFFGYDNFRLINGFNYQEEAVISALKGESLLAVFPTGGGKSLTFQLPAIMVGNAEGGLTVVISPLQSLMKDQVDNLQNKLINDAVTINGMLDPIERNKAIQMVEDGSAKILYISPEMLRSKTIENLLLRRNVVRFVIDEAHCFSSWGQDFRVDYLYIATFINTLRNAKSVDPQRPKNIPVSCFTATAKPKVIEDIKGYFKDKMNIELVSYIASSERKNLTYHVIEQQNVQDKFISLLDLLGQNPGSTIVYSSQTKQCEIIARKLVDYGYTATYFHGKLNKEEKTENQEAFMKGQATIMVATTAFGMGVDKSDVMKVIHYDISDSLENYVQEAGRAGRDESLNAECYVIFDEEDLNKHFMLLNQSKISIKEIQQVWKAIKDLTRMRKTMTKSALEIAKAAGWEDDIADVETKVRTAINALEQRNFVKRNQNVPRLFANSLAVKSMNEAVELIDASDINEALKINAKRVVKSLVSHKYQREDKTEAAETRVDYLSDILEIDHNQMLTIIRHLKELHILENHNDFQAIFAKSDDEKKISKEIQRYLLVERHMINLLEQEDVFVNLKEQNACLSELDDKININSIKAIILFLETEKLIARRPAGQKNCYYIRLLVAKETLLKRSEEREKLIASILDFLFVNKPQDVEKEQDFLFSYKQIKDYFEHNLLNSGEVSYTDIESALFFMKKTDCIKLEGAFSVLYNAMQIERKNDVSTRYTLDDYKMLELFYKSKMEQIHIVGEYAKKMLESTHQALVFVNDYFTLNYESFMQKYFRGKKEELGRSLTPKKFKQIFTDLNETQLQIINDKSNNYVVAAAGPGSGKTRVLVHKLASLCLLEDVKHEQLLMLTFSRAAATEFKERLLKLIGKTAHYIHITTFHSYCFDLLERVGSIENSANIVKDAVEKIRNNEVDLSRITKTVLVIDEAQDMSEDEYNLVELLMSHNEQMRVLAVGDDDQNIYEFRGSDSKYLKKLVDEHQAKNYEMLLNYRSKSNLIDFSNLFVKKIRNRMKHHPIVANDLEKGTIIITRYPSTSLVIPVANHVMSESLIGSVCVLTLTNDLAVNINGYLLQNQVQSKLIQTNEGFSLLKLVEIRHFINTLKAKSQNDFLDDQSFEDAKRSMIQTYKESINLESCVRLVDKYQTTNKALFLSEFIVYVHESTLETIDQENQHIFVSTVHQAKGKEFDNIFLCIHPGVSLTEEAKHILYVALTRAKSHLFIHDAGGVFGKEFNLLATKVQTDDTMYEEPEQISLYLTHRDVSLGGFKYTQWILGKMKAGDVLTIDKEYCLFGDKKAVYFSTSFKIKLEEFENKGYVPSTGFARHILYWSSKDEPDNELLICLPMITLVKKTDA